MITVTRRPDATQCPLCGDTGGVCLIRLDSDYLSTSFALCRKCRTKLARKMKEMDE
jgi:hypothetical protein